VKFRGYFKTAGSSGGSCEVSPKNNLGFLRQKGLDLKKLINIVTDLIDLNQKSNNILYKKSIFLFNFVTIFLFE
jgi:hypothetical protein